MPIWLLELFCPEHGMPVLLEALRRYWSVWQMGMRAHRIARSWARNKILAKWFNKIRGICASEKV